MRIQAQATELKASFPAMADGWTRVLILGSLPGEVSLERRQYYANPTNQFWRLTGAVIEKDLVALPYHDRLSALLGAGIGLWDVVKSARRTGSSDSEIRDHKPNALGEIAGALPSLKAIAFNGGKSFAIGRKQLGGDDTHVLVALPSSSAAYCSIPFERKQSEWLQLRAFLDRAA